MSDFTLGTTPANRVRQTGFRHGKAGTPQRPPADATLRSAYLAGYRRGVEAAERDRLER